MRMIAISHEADRVPPSVANSFPPSNSYQQAENDLHKIAKDIPANGWQSPLAQEKGDPFAGLDYLAGVARVMVAALPQELIHQVFAIIRQMLALLQNLIDKCIEALSKERLLNS